LNEAIFDAVPLSQDIDRVVELSRPDSGQEAGLQEAVNLNAIIISLSHLNIVAFASPLLTRRSAVRLVLSREQKRHRPGPLTAACFNATATKEAPPA